MVEWVDLDVVLCRSVIAPSVWSPVLEGTDQAHTFDGAGPLRAAQRYAIAEARAMGYIEPADCPASDLRWHRRYGFGETLNLQQRVRKEAGL